MPGRIGNRGRYIRREQRKHESSQSHYEQYAIAQSHSCGQFLAFPSRAVQYTLELEYRALPVAQRLQECPGYVSDHQAMDNCESYVPQDAAGHSRERIEVIA